MRRRASGETERRCEELSERCVMRATRVGKAARRGAVMMNNDDAATLLIWRCRVRGSYGSQR